MAAIQMRVGAVRAVKLLDGGSFFAFSSHRKSEASFLMLLHGERLDRYRLLYKPPHGPQIITLEKAISIIETYSGLIEYVPGD